MKIRFFLLFVGVIFCCSSCNDTKKQGQKMTANTFRCLNCSDGPKSGNPEYDRLKIVKLETTDQCLVANIKRIEVTDSIILIQDRLSQLFAFDKEGRFIARIGKNGQGPGEYVELSIFYVDDKNVVIVDNGKNLLIKYDFNGKYLKSEKIPEGSLTMCYNAKYTKDNKLLLCHMIKGLNTGDNLAYYLMDLDSCKLTGKYFSYDPITLNFASVFSTNPMTYSGEEIDFILPLCDTIYSYPSFAPKYIVEIPQKMASKNQIKKNTDSYRTEIMKLSNDFFIGFMNIFETKNKILMKCMYNKTICYFFGDKTTQEGYYYVEHSHDMNKTYQKIPFIEIAHSFDNSLIGIITPLELSRYNFDFDSQYADGQQLKHLLSISLEDDNPFLLFYEFD
jgi:hypothetical protein